jgi:glycerol-3-phosphate dehydrogenase
LIDDPDAKKRILASRGTHVVLKGNLAPRNTGIIIPKTSDGRLLFIINYLGNTLVGTTDVEQEPSFHSKPSDQEILFIKDELLRIFGKDFDFDSNLLSSWSGLRPLVIPEENWQKKELEE